MAILKNQTVIKLLTELPKEVVLVPCLIFSNDLHKVLENCHCILFADYTTIYFTHENLRFLQWNVLADLGKLADWFRANKLTLNLKKTVGMLFTHKKLTEPMSLEMEGIVIPLVEQTKFLGIWLDQNLNWKYHVNNLVVKLKRNLNMLKESQYILNKHSMKFIYYAQIYSHLCYGISLWENHVSNDNIEKLQKIQNKCLQYILNNKEINKEDYKGLKMLRIKQIIKLETVKFAYKIKNSLLPKQIMNCVNTDQFGRSLKKVHRYNTRNRELPYKPKVKTSQYLNSLLCKSTSEFLTLKDETRSSLTLSSFNHRCKNELLHALT